MSAAALARRLVRPEAPHALAALRVAVPAMILASPELHEAKARAAWARSAFVAPEGLGWFVRHAPISPGLALAAQSVAVASALALALGLRARAAAAILLVSAGYSFALAQLSGSVLHHMHLLWFSAILAVSPCADVFAVGARERGPPAPSRAYAWPLVGVRALFAAVYFFPGFWKLATSGAAWVLSDNLATQMHWKWAEWGGWLPPLRVDRLPALTRLGAGSVVLFELAAPILLFAGARARLAFCIGGLVFHGLAYALLRIPFWSLLACYVGLVDWSRFADEAPRASDDAPLVPRPARLAVVVGAALALLAVVQGARGQMQAFPFACYPTFQWIPAREMPDVRVVVTRADGREERSPPDCILHTHRSQDGWGRVWRLIGAYDGVVDRPRLTALAREMAKPLPGDRVRVERVRCSVAPEDWGDPPVRVEPLFEWTE